MTVIDTTDLDAHSLTDLAAGHDAFTTVDEIGGDATTDAPATSPACVAALIIGATVGAGC